MTEQGSQAWKDERAGKVTASRISDVLTKPRKGQRDSAVRSNYRAQLICEILSGKPVQDEYQSWDMKLGIEREPTARAEYEIRRDVIIQTVGFVPHPVIKRAGCSPDGFIGEDGLVQFKCPKTATQIAWILAGVVPAEHRPQMCFEMSCTGRQWADFVSYEPNLPDHLQLFIVRMVRDEAELIEIELEVQRFLSEIDEIISKLPRREGETSLEVQLERSLARPKKDPEADLEITDADMELAIAAQGKLERERAEKVRPMPKATDGTTAEELVKGAK